MNFTDIAEGLTVVQVDVEDIDAAADLFTGYLDFYGRQATLDEAREFLRQRLTRKESIVLLARRAGEWVGFTQVYPTFSSVSMAPVWVLNDLFVRPDARRGGVGRTLLRAVVDQAAAAGAVRVTLDTAADNTSAQALYESEGFTTDHPVKYYLKRTR
ncbi:GNAT family N-acetyltransferase [Couchioplanes caeruleus]|uniref:GNAT family N-acetyltransferase n=2 Tax=Couchioplanes caeruleus TaxID=56438 RepID=A0A1K0GZL1_9ACTN|nr:GNAT family N-acetyltransferase [Couchioplanes caeruleus]OJF14867.1 GNAT family N-acetyltransferase [Couchioplanes caeruleus subsp. caeruleus]ROP32163.1 acetyltransferase (GNAT) family protein [Couchioplanes caeruleus]